MDKHCRTCHAYASYMEMGVSGECRLRAPEANGFPSVDDDEWCLEWRAVPVAVKKPTVALELGDFERFWLCYPKKTGKKAAFKAWGGAFDKPTIETILLAVDAAKRSEQWLKDGGQFIPLPATWLNQGRWMDQEAAKPMNTFDSFLARGEQHHADTTRFPERLALSDSTAVGEDVSPNDRDDAIG